MQALRTLGQRKNAMADDFEQRIEAIDQMTKEIAEIEHTAWFILDQYKLVQDQISKVRAKYEKRFSGALASEDLLRKKIESWKEDLSLRNDAMPKNKRPSTARMSTKMGQTASVARSVWLQGRGASAGTNPYQRACVAPIRVIHCCC